MRFCSSLWNIVKKHEAQNRWRADKGTGEGGRAWLREVWRHKRGNWGKWGVEVVGAYKGHYAAAQS